MNDLELLTSKPLTGEGFGGEVSAEDVVEGERFCVRFVRFRILRRKLRTCRNKREGISVGWQPPAWQPYWARSGLGCLGLRGCTVKSKLYDEVRWVMGNCHMGPLPVTRLKTLPFRNFVGGGKDIPEPKCANVNTYPIPVVQYMKNDLLRNPSDVHKQVSHSCLHMSHFSYTCKTE